MVEAIFLGEAARDGAAADGFLESTLSLPTLGGPCPQEGPAEPKIPPLEEAHSVLHAFGDCRNDGTRASAT